MIIDGLEEKDIPKKLSKRERMLLIIGLWQRKKESRKQLLHETKEKVCGQSRKIIAT